MVLDHDIHVLLLCEVFGIADHFNEDQKIASRLVKFLNEQGKSSSAEQPAARQWAGVGCYHYVALWRTDLGFTCEDEHSFHCRIASRPWQKGQYLRFVNKDWPHCVHIINTHCVSGEKKLTNAMRRTVANTAWDIVCNADTAAQPVAIFCGDYNNNMVQWRMVIDAMPKGKWSRVQLCVSRNFEINDISPKHGDQALAINCLALMEHSRYGKTFRKKGVRTNGFSDAHDLVLVPILFENTKRKECGSAAARQVRRLEGARMSLWECGGSTFLVNEPAPADASPVGRIPEHATRPWNPASAAQPRREEGQTASSSRGEAQRIQQSLPLTSPPPTRQTRNELNELSDVSDEERLLSQATRRKRKHAQSHEHALEKVGSHLLPIQLQPDEIQPQPQPQVQPQLQPQPPREPPSKQEMEPQLSDAVIAQVEPQPSQQQGCSAGQPAQRPARLQQEQRAGKRESEKHEQEHEQQEKRLRENQPDLEHFNDFAQVASMIVERNPDLEDALTNIATHFLFDTGKFKDIIYVEGLGYQKLAMTFTCSAANKWQHLLKITRERYEIAVSRRHGGSAAQPAFLTDKEMRDQMNEWRKNPESWLRNKERYNELLRETTGRSGQRMHLYLKQTFSTYQMQLCGCKPLVSALIQMPLHKSKNPVWWCEAFLQAILFLIYVVSCACKLSSLVL